MNPKPSVRLAMAVVFVALIAATMAARAGGPVAIDIFPDMAGIGVGALSDCSGSNDCVGGDANRFIGGMELGYLW